jgi:hypothetical protein
VAERNPVPKSGLNIRLKPESITQIDALAVVEHRNRSDMVRVLLIEAIEARQKRGAR